MRCYKRLLCFGKIKSNLRSVQEEIKADYKKGAVRTKRLRRDSSETDGVNISRPIERSAAAKSLKFAQFAPTTSTSSGFEPLESHGEASTLSTGHEGTVEPVYNGPLLSGHPRSVFKVPILRSYKCYICYLYFRRPPLLSGCGHPVGSNVCLSLLFLPVLSGHP